MDWGSTTAVEGGAVAAADALKEVLASGLPAPDATGYGSLRESEGVVIGRVGRVAKSGEDWYVLDDRLNAVHKFDRLGTSLGRVGRSGGGPGEFSIPTGLAVSERDLFVSDERRVIHWFQRPNLAGPWEWKSDIRTDLVAQDICLVGDDLIALGVREDTHDVLHRYNGGRWVESFAPIYDNPDIYLRYVVGEGRLMCDANREQVVWVAKNWAAVAAFGLDGDLRWSRRLERLIPVSILEDPGRGAVRVGLESPAGTMHMLHGLSPVGGEGLLIQHGVFDSAAVVQDWPATVVSHLVDLETGAALPLGPGTDSEVTGVVWVEDGLIATATDSPFPRVSIQSWDGPEGTATNDGGDER